MPSANDFLGNGGLSQRMGASPFGLGSPFAGAQRDFSEGPRLSPDNWTNQFERFGDYLTKQAPHKPAVDPRGLMGPTISGGELNPPAPDIEAEHGLDWWLTGPETNGTRKGLQAISQKTPPQAAPILQNASAGAAGGLEALVDETLPHIVQAESGGNAAAKNPLSSATGLGQITSGTWKALQKAHPELALTDVRDPKQNLAATRALGVDNAKYLQSHGLPVTRGTIYMAHFLGNGGAADVLVTPDTVPMANAVSGAVMAANPFLRGMTVGQFKQWAERKMGGAAASLAGGAGLAAKGIAGAKSAMAGAFAPEAAAAVGNTASASGKGTPATQEVAAGLLQEALQPAMEPDAISAQDKLAILRQFMALAGFTPEEIG